MTSLIKSRILALVVVVGAIAAAPQMVEAAEVTIENRSDQTLDVAVAYNFYNGDTVSLGWYNVKPGKTWTFEAPDEADLHLRVQANGNEITFTNHDKYLYFPTITQRFNVSKESDDADTWTFTWGSKLENSRSIKKASVMKGTLPTGWSSKRFFRIGTGNHNLTVK